MEGKLIVHEFRSECVLSVMKLILSMLNQAYLCDTGVLRQRLFDKAKPYLSTLMTKPTKRHERTAKTQISLGSLIRVFAVAQWVPKDPSFLHVDSEDSGCPGWSDSSLGGGVHMPFCWFCHEAAHIWNGITRLQRPLRFSSINSLLYLKICCG